MYPSPQGVAQFQHRDHLQAFVRSADGRVHRLIAGTPEAKDLFSMDVAKAWEHAFNEAITPQTRKVALRTAMVFSTQPGRVVSGVFADWFVAGWGERWAADQFVSWIHQEDFCRAVEWLIDQDELVAR